ncbi:Uncharacterised protein [Klebsiella pneumoniae]|nr:Uncharacterised protein [Klebsiella pneumoniae]
MTLVLLPRLAHWKLALFKRGEQLRVGRRVECRQGEMLQTDRATYLQDHQSQQHNAGSNQQDEAQALAPPQVAPGEKINGMRHGVHSPAPAQGR